VRSKQEFRLGGSVPHAPAQPRADRRAGGTGAAGVGEIAALLELRQPQATKHLQTLQRAGLVTMHPLGQRRIYALRREPLRELRRWLERFDVDHPDEDILERYRRAIEAEKQRQDAGRARTLAFERQLPARPAAVWRSWTSADAVRRWWSPRHFVVAGCDVDPVPGGPLRIVMEEGDDGRHVATGRFLDLRPRTALSFELAPLDRGGVALFSAVHDVSPARSGTAPSCR
jgi:DNA-binding transcriptional ArsR family regulator